jgi:hypothetical protein
MRNLLLMIATLADIVLPTRTGNATDRHGIVNTDRRK